MGNTKSHPGAFKCYEAALPDEPMFVILGRDPAGPATLEFWATERVRQEKVHERDDQDRIKAAVDEAKDMAAWRTMILDSMDPIELVPAWKLPRQIMDDDGPVREITSSPALAAPYGGGMRPKDRELLVNVGKEIREITHELQHWWRNDDSPRPGDAMNALIARFHAEVEKLADAYRAEPEDPYVEFAKNLGKPVEHIWYDSGKDPECEHPIKCLPLSFTRMAELLDYATCYGEFDEETPNGTISQYGESMSSPMNDARRHAIWIYKRCMGIVPEGAEPPVAVEPAPSRAVYTEGLFMIPGHKEPQTMAQIAEVYRLAHAPLPKAPTLDSAPDDLAHAPEVPHHRFSVFHEAGDYAYARGLEVNPMHLATALDAMAKSDWHLLAIFGATDTQHIGFIFKREKPPIYSITMPEVAEETKAKFKAILNDAPEFSAFERAHGFGEPLPTMTRPRGSEFAQPEVAEAYASGKPLDEIAKIAIPEEVKQRTFTIVGLDPETTHHLKATWDGDLAKARRWMESWRPDKRNAFLLSEKAESVEHYWGVASVASVLRLIAALEKRDHLWLADLISPAALAKVLGCGDEPGQEPCAEYGRGLQP